MWTYAEPDIPPPVAEEVRNLFEEAFPGIFGGRTYFKQMPHRRLIAFDGREVVGQVGLDFRAIRVGNNVVGICGLVDLCVRSDKRGRGTASALIREVEAHARQGDLSFLILMADRHDLYARHGFVCVRPAVTTWLGIEDRRSVGLIERDLSGCFMVKALTTRTWPKGPIALLGYLF